MADETRRAILKGSLCPLLFADSGRFFIFLGLATLFLLLEGDEEGGNRIDSNGGLKEVECDGT